MPPTTIIVDEQLLGELKLLAAERGQTLSALADKILREAVERARTAEELPPRGTDIGRELVNVADRDALYDVFDGESSLIRPMKHSRS
jgi:hypothetical protein